MFNDHGQSIQEATPAVPVEITGFDDVPTTGETFIVMDDERTADNWCSNVWKINGRPMFLSSRKRIWKNIFSQLEEAGSLELNLLLKADVQGSVEALRNSLSQLGNEKICTLSAHRSWQRHRNRRCAGICLKCDHHCLQCSGRRKGS